MTHNTAWDYETKIGVTYCLLNPNGPSLITILLEFASKTIVHTHLKLCVTLVGQLF